MNIYEQLQAVRTDLEDRNARAQSIQVIDKMLKLAESQRESSLSFSRLQVLRRVMQTPEVLNNEDVRLDFIALEGDLEEAAQQRDQGTFAYEEDRRPKLKKYYKKKD